MFHALHILQLLLEINKYCGFFNKSLCIFLKVFKGLKKWLSERHFKKNCIFKQHQVTADSKYLDLCLHLLISSPLLFKLSLSSELLRIVDFSSRQSLQDLVDGL